MTMRVQPAMHSRQQRSKHVPNGCRPIVITALLRTHGALTDCTCVACPNSCLSPPPQQWACAALCTLLFYGKPLVHVLPEILTPMQRMLSMPHGKAFSQFGAVAVLPWMLVCDRAGSMLVQAVFPARRRPLPPPSRTAAGSEAELQAEAPSAEAKKAQ